MIARLPGTSSAAATPWTPRAAMSVTVVGARPQTSDAAPNETRPMRKSFRRPKRSPSEPPTTRNDPRVSRYALSTHWSPARSVSRSLAIVGQRGVHHAAVEERDPRPEHGRARSPNGRRRYPCGACPARARTRTRRSWGGSPCDCRRSGRHRPLLDAHSSTPTLRLRRDPERPRIPGRGRSAMMAAELVNSGSVAVGDVLVRGGTIVDGTGGAGRVRRRACARRTHRRGRRRDLAPDG